MGQRGKGLMMNINTDKVVFDADTQKMVDELSAEMHGEVKEKFITEMKVLFHCKQRFEDIKNLRLELNCSCFQYWFSQAQGADTLH